MSAVSSKKRLVELTNEGLYCSEGGFYIDPKRKVSEALITHGHSDHARYGMGSYLTSTSGMNIVRERVGKDSAIQGIAFGERLKIRNVTVSFHPAGHLLGSSQIRIESKKEVCCVTGDFKVGDDRSCEPFELVKCDHLITESTFALPFYKWPEPETVFEEINQWWRANQAQGKTSVLFAYALGKAQRILCGLDPSIGPIGVHGSVHIFNEHYRAAGRPIPETLRASQRTKSELLGKGIIIAPGSTRNSNWLKQFYPASLSFASGWMLVNGALRRRGVDQGFVLSDHADWGELLKTIKDSGASSVGVTHGYTDVLSKWLLDKRQLDAYEIPPKSRRGYDKRQISFINELF